MKPMNEVRVTKTTISMPTDAGKQVASREIRIPELYRRPMPDRGLQGCLKARA